MNRLILSGLLLLAGCCALSMGDLCTPDQWEGFQASMGGYSNFFHAGGVWEHSHVSYDAKHKRKASLVHYKRDGFEDKYQVVVRYDAHNDHNDDGTGKMYIVDLRTNFCWSKTLFKPFQKRCIPEDAKPHPSYYIGLEKTGLQVSAYIAKKHNMGVYIAVAKSGDAIIPVYENVHGRFLKTSFIQDIHFADIRVGIKNETIFDVPKQCNGDKDQDASIHEYLMREHFSLAV